MANRQPIDAWVETLGNLDYMRDIEILKTQINDEISTQRLDRLSKLIGGLYSGLRLARAKIMEIENV